MRAGPLPAYSREKAESQLYKAYARGRTLAETAGAPNSERVSITLQPEDDPGAAKETPRALGERVRASDLVITGRVLSRVVHLTDDQKFLFTDFQIAVSKVLKGGGKVSSGSLITVSRPGGAALIHGRLIEVHDLAYETLQTGRLYLLFLRYAQAADIYQALDSQSTFLASSKLKTMTSRPDMTSRRLQDLDPQTVLAHIAAASGN